MTENKRKKTKITSNLILRLSVKKSDINDSNIFEKKPAITEESLLKDVQDNYTIRLDRNTVHNKFIKPYKRKEYININNGNWVRQTNVKCWWCSYTFDNTPCGIPLEYCDDSKEYKQFGCFCSFNCSLAYIIKFIEDRKYEKSALLHMMFQKIFGRTERISPAFPREILKDYGGILNIDEYREKCCHNQIALNMVIPPITAIDPQIERRNIMLSIKRLNRDTSRNNYEYDEYGVPEVKPIKKKSFAEKFKKKK